MTQPTRLVQPRPGPHTKQHSLLKAKCIYPQNNTICAHNHHELNRSHELARPCHKLPPLNADDRCLHLTLHCWFLCVRKKEWGLREGGHASPSWKRGLCMSENDLPNIFWSSILQVLHFFFFMKFFFLGFIKILQQNKYWKMLKIFFPKKYFSTKQTEY